MPPQVSTLNDDPPILSDREFLEGLAGQISGIAGAVDGLTNDLDLIKLQHDIQAKQLDHLDGMVHEVHQFIEEHRPALAKALAFLSPGASIRDYFGKGARRERDHD